MKAGKIARRMTRRSFRRKLIMFGASIFASLAITATGFATWVLSADASHKTEGGIDVASVSDSSVTIENIAFLDKNGDDPIRNFTFEPAANDETGRVHVDRDNNSEDMDVRLGWTIKNYQYVDTTFIEFKVPEGVYNAMQKGYLALPDAFAPQTNGDGLHVTETIDNVKYYVYQFNAPAISTSGNTADNLLAWTVNQTDSVTDVVFTLTLKFLWGDTFAGTNPSIYYDENVAGKAIDFDTVKKTLIDLKATIYGVSDLDKVTLLTKSAEEQNDFYATLVAPSYKVVVNTPLK